MKESPDRIGQFHQLIPIWPAKKAEADRHFDARRELSMGSDRDAHVIFVGSGAFPRVTLRNICRYRD
jgi:hypothetical protein